MDLNTPTLTTGVVLSFFCGQSLSASPLRESYSVSYNRVIDVELTDLGLRSAVVISSRNLQTICSLYKIRISGFRSSQTRRDIWAEYALYFLGMVTRGIVVAFVVARMNALYPGSLGWH